MRAPKPMPAPGVWLLVSVAGCGGATYGGPAGNAGLTVPTPIAEGKPKGSEPVIPVPPKGQPKGQPTTPGAATAEANGRGRATERGTLPDPPPLRAAKQWEYTLGYKRGRVEVKSARAIELGVAVMTPRRIGRFAVELWIGKELLDRVRFDFPLLGAPKTEAKHVDLELGAESQATVQVPATSRTRRVVLVDRSTGRELELPVLPE